MRVDAAVQQRLAEHRQVAGGGKEAGVPRDAAHGARVFVVHFAPRQAPAKIRRRALSVGGDLCAQTPPWLTGGDIISKHGVACMPSGIEDALSCAS